MERSVFFALVSALSAAACGGEEELGADVSAHGLTISDVTFENYALGALGSPWSVTTDPGRQSRATIVSSTDHGRILLLHGGSTSPSFLIATLPLSSSAQEISASTDIRLAQGAAFVWSLSGAGPSIGSRRIRLQVSPGTTTLVASTVPSGNTSCGALRAGAWSKVTLDIHAAAHRFDVRIDDQPTACTGIAANIGPPFNSVGIMDASNTGWGGDVGFDNFSITAN